MRRWSAYNHNRQGWFRIYGYGVKWEDTTVYGLTLSERLGYSKGITIGKWRIGILK